MNRRREDLAALAALAGIARDSALAGLAAAEAARAATAARRDSLRPPDAEAAVAAGAPVPAVELHARWVEAERAALNLRLARETAAAAEARAAAARAFGRAAALEALAKGVDRRRPR